MMGANVSASVGEATLLLETLLKIVSDPAAAKGALDKIAAAQKVLDARSADIAKREDALRANETKAKVREASLVKNEEAYAARVAALAGETRDLDQKRKLQEAELAAVRFQQEETRRSLLAKDADVNQRAHELGQKADTLNRQAAGLDARQKALGDRDAALMTHEEAFMARRERLMAAMAET